MLVAFCNTIGREFMAGCRHGESVAAMQPCNQAPDGLAR